MLEVLTRFPLRRLDRIFWLTVSLNFYQLKHHHNQSNRKSSVTSQCTIERWCANGKQDTQPSDFPLALTPYPRHGRVTLRWVKVWKYFILDCNASSAGFFKICFQKIVGNRSRILWILDIQKCTMAWLFENIENHNKDNKLQPWN